MFFRKRIISISDRERLLLALDRARQSWITYAPYLDGFRAELRRTQGVPADAIPGNVITMGSRFTVSESRTGDELHYTLAYPEDEVHHTDRVSILSPMGTALLGARVGEEVAWISSSGPEAATIRRLIYQPERDAPDYLDRIDETAHERKELVTL